MIKKTLTSNLIGQLKEQYNSLFKFQPEVKHIISSLILNDINEKIYKYKYGKIIMEEGKYYILRDEISWYNDCVEEIPDIILQSFKNIKVNIGNRTEEEKKQIDKFIESSESIAYMDAKFEVGKDIANSSLLNNSITEKAIIYKNKFIDYCIKVLSAEEYYIEEGFPVIKTIWNKGTKYKIIRINGVHISRKLCIIINEDKELSRIEKEWFIVFANDLTEKENDKYDK